MDRRSKTSSPTPVARPAVKNILRNVECHVRLMSHLENTSTSSSYTSVRIKNTQMDTWSDAFTVTRVHRGTSTDIFFRDVIAPCVANCMAGQSYLFLVCGPPESGRSQTLYGSPHQSAKGIIELAAEELLQYAAGKSRDGTHDPGKSCATVTHSAFTMRGTHMVETRDGSPVPIVEFPPPLAATPLPHMQLLDSAQGAVLIPERKTSDTSCVVQFQVYSPVDSLGRRSMATLTFVDVAAFRQPNCTEIRHLVETVRRVVGVSEAGDPCFKQTKLTTLLESALVGYVTLVSITTISGRADLYGSACEALRFAETLSRIHQVLMLVHINTPKWFIDAAEKVDALRLTREQLLSDQRARGVHDYYLAVCKWLSQHVGDVDGSFDKLLEEVERIRRDLACEVEERTKELQARIHQAQEQCTVQLERTRAAHAATEAQLDRVKRLDETMAALNQQLTQRDLFNDHRISEMRIEISTLESETSMHRQELARLEKEERLYQNKYKEVVGVLDKYADDLANAQMHYVFATEMNTIGEKKRRLEADLALASHVAHQETDTIRADRERRSKLARLTVMQQKVDALRERVQTNSGSFNTCDGTGSRCRSDSRDSSTSGSFIRKQRRHVDSHHPTT
ncbi:hypothetical protein TRVL_00120 [Trypanosoma vivax]|nr:hypothetical protein TRVL_00120 [Trypanosoma vivax]